VKNIILASVYHFTLMLQTKNYFPAHFHTIINL